MAQPPSELPSAQPKSKAAKVWKRTWVGASLALGMVLVLWGASALDSTLPMLAVSCAVLAVCIFEVSRMGSLRSRKLGWVLGSASVLVVAVFAFWMRAAPSLEEVDVGQFAGFLLFETTRVSLLATFGACALFRVESSFVKALALAFLACNVVLAPVLDAPWTGFAQLVLFFFLCARCLLLGGRALRLETGAVVLLGTLLIVSVPSLALVWALFGHLGLVALLVIAKLGDTAGYYVGSTLGRHKPFKSISPNKTAEGCVGSLVASALAGVGAVALGWLPNEPYGYLGGLAAGAIVNVAAQASDLLESWVKRKAGVKDSGTWFSTSGGMLDLIDSFFLATPVALIAWPLVFDFAPLFGVGE